MPTNPSQSIIDYFKWKAQNVPTGTPSLDPNNPNDPPNIDLNVPPLSEAEYLTQKSSIYEYVNQEYIDQAGLKDNAILNVDKLNAKYTTDLSQNVLNKALEDMIKYSGGKDATIYSSLSYSGFTSTDLKDYLKLILRKPSSEDKRSLERRRGSLLSTEDFANNIARDSWFSVAGVTENDEEINILTSPLKKWDQTVDNIGTTGANFFNSINDTISDKVVEFSKITSQIDEETMSEIYGDDGVVEIFLPLPKEIIEVYAHEIEQAELGGFNQLLNTLQYAKGAGAVIGRGAQAAAFLIGGQATAAGTLSNASIPGLQNFISGLQGSMDFVSATTRKAYNPVQEQLYKTPQPRVFQWTIELMPTSQDQAKSTAMICQALKEHSSPINIGDLFYDFPGFVEFEFYINNRLATFLPRSLYFDKESKTKVPSFIKSLNIQYSSNNMYSHFVDDYPTNSTITIELLETQPLDRNIIMGDAGNNSVVKGIDKVNNEVSIRPISIID
jgi:hypothetical protein